MKIITIIFAIIASVSYSQQENIQVCKYGFINEEGKEITPLKYDYANSFSEGIAKVCVNKKWGFINKNGKEITPIKYDTVYTCKSGVARVKLNGKYGLIDETGKEIMAIKYDNIGLFEYHVACVKIDGKWGIINNKGIEITPLKYDYMQKTNAYSILCLKNKDKITLVDENSLPIEANPEGYFNDNTSYFDESGIGKVCLNGKWGFIDKTGKEISAIKYDYVFFFSEGMARVLLNNKWGFINKSGNEVIPLIYDFIDEELRSKPSCGNVFRNQGFEQPVYFFRNGKAVKYIDAEFLDEQHIYFNHNLVCIPTIKKTSFEPEFDRYIFLDKKGNTVSTKYDSLAPFYYNSGRTKKDFYFDGLLKVEKYENGIKYGFADTLGRVVIPVKYESVYDFKDGVSRVSLDKEYGLINKKGEQVAPFKYSGIWEFYDGVARVNITEGFSWAWGIIDNNGKELTTIKYDFVNEFTEGFAVVKLKGKMGYIDLKGNEIVTPKYANAVAFFEGFAQVVNGGKVGYIDKTGKEITLIKYDQTQAFKNGFAGVGIGNKWGFINKTGKEVTPIKYDGVENFKGGFAVVKIFNE